MAYGTDAETKCALQNLLAAYDALAETYKGAHRE